VQTTSPVTATISVHVVSEEVDKTSTKMHSKVDGLITRVRPMTKRTRVVLQPFGAGKMESTNIGDFGRVARRVGGYNVTPLEVL
jgi:hypothetical protein